MNTSHQYWGQPSAKVINRMVTGQAMVAAIASPVLGGFWIGATVRGLGWDGVTGALCRCHGGAWYGAGCTSVEGRGSGKSANSGVISEEVLACKARLIRSSNSHGIEPALGQVLAKVFHGTIAVRVTDPRLHTSPVRRRIGRRGGYWVNGFGIGGSGFAHASQYPLAAVRPPGPDTKVLGGRKEAAWAA